MQNRHLFERMQEYIDTNYESRYLNAVYISGDGGAWIKAGAQSIEKGVLVLDKFHMMKYINKAANQITGTEGISVRPNRGYMRELLLHHHDNDRVYIEKMQATIPSIDIRKKLAIRE